MPPRIPKLLPAAIFLGLVFALVAQPTPAQQPIPLLPPPGGQAAPAAQPAQADPNAPEVLARGPVHEAFAATSEAPTASPIVPKQPPEAIEELPPDQKPDGENVQWIPGYWHWDDDSNQFIWISGLWRAVPPGRVWVPGSWREARGGFQWVPGFWAEPQPQQPQQPEIQYLPEPPATLELGPRDTAPTTTSFYVPGSWVWRGRYVWRPGFWIEHRPGWVWVPAHYRWSPVGYVYVDGYWDYPLADRGVLFAPVVFQPAVIAQPTFVYTPTYVVSEPCMVGALFVRRGWGCYYFGDYFGARYTSVGFNAWCGTVGPNGGFAVGFGVGRTWGYDPLWSYYSVAYRSTPGWFVGVGNLYGGRFAGTIARPPVTLVQQNTVINNITNVNVTNVTNNVTVVNKNVTVNNKNVTDVAMLAPVSVAKDLQPEAKIRPISAQVRKDEAVLAKQTRDVGAQRTKLENTAVAQGKPMGKGPDAPQTLKLEVPKTVVARAQVAAEKKAPPANPIRDPKAAVKVDPKIDHKLEPHPVFVNPKGEPRPNPKIDPIPNPKVDPKVDPKTKVDPKVDPKGLPKLDPKVDPKGVPKVDPKGIPKVDPKGIPKIDPKVDPKGVPKIDPLPKFDPKLPGNPNPIPLPKIELPKVDPKPIPKVEPKPAIDPVAAMRARGVPDRGAAKALAAPPTPEKPRAAVRPVPAQGVSRFLADRPAPERTAAPARAVPQPDEKRRPAAQQRRPRR